MNDRPTLTTRTIGETESALNGLLTKALAGSGIGELEWIALRLVSAMPPPLQVMELTAQLRRSKKVSEEAASSALGELEDRGFLDRTGVTIAFTPEGRRLFEQLSGEVGSLITRMWEGLDPEDLAVAARLLTTITERANSLLAG